MKNKFFSLVLAVIMLTYASLSFAQEIKVEYPEQVIVDSDLDGLTDEGEKQIFKTDPQKSDTDSDGFGDGVETLSEIDPLDANLFPGIIEKMEVLDEEIPLAWYISRITGLVAFALLYISIFLGLTLRVPLLRKLFKPLYAMNIHCWISVQATILAFVHGGALFFDKYIEFKLIDIFVPFISTFQPQFLSMGIIAFYLMIILVITSYMRNNISHRVWRAVHFANIFLYIFVVVHAAALGTDLKNPIAFNIFLYANAFLVFLMLINMQLRIAERIRMRKEASLSGEINIGSKGV